MALSENVAQPTKAIGATRVFVIREMQRVGSALEPTGIFFAFSAQNFAAPRGPWSYGLRLRTNRKDLPGDEQPVEQVLGWNYTPFTCAGIWDDRHNDLGFAEETRQNFENMVKRGKIVRLSFESITINGLITELQIDRLRKDYIGYKFTFSPHNRELEETVRVDSNPALKTTLDPRTSVRKAREGLDQLESTQGRAQGGLDRPQSGLSSLGGGSHSNVQQVLSTDIFREINDDISDISALIRSAETTVENEILKADDAANALNRGAQTMASIKTSISSLLNRTRVVASTTHVAVSTIVDLLKFETWLRGIGENSRRLVLTVDKSQKDFELRAKPKPTRLHRVRQGETLYTISTRYYGTPHHWRQILKHNHLSSIILEGGELLAIPEVR